MLFLLVCSRLTERVSSCVPLPQLFADRATVAFSSGFFVRDPVSVFRGELCGGFREGMGDDRPGEGTVVVPPPLRRIAAW